MKIRIDQAPIPPVTLSSMTMTVARREDVGPLVGRLFDRVFAAYAADGTPTGTPIAWYDDASGETHFGAGLDTPLAEPGAFGLTNISLDGSERGWLATYRGPLPGVVDAWRQLAEHITAAGDTPTGVCREIYLEPAMDFAADWVIELQQPVV